MNRGHMLTFLEIWIYQSELIEIEIRLQGLKGMPRVLLSEYKKYQEKWKNDCSYKTYFLTLKDRLNVLMFKTESRGHITSLCISQHGPLIVTY